MTQQRYLRTAFTVGCIASILITPVSTARGASTRDILSVAAAEAQPSRLKADGDATLRQEMVHVDVDELARIAHLPSPEQNESLILTVFGEALHVHIERLDVAAPSRFVIHGRLISGNSRGSVTIVVADRIAQGNISTADGRHFSLRYAGGAYEIAQLDIRHVTACGNEKHDSRSLKTLTEAEASSAMRSPTKMSAEGDVGRPIIDMMFVYTPAMRQKTGGDAAIRAMCDLAIAEVNRTFMDSGVTAEVRLVHVQEVSYTESGTLVTDCERLQRRSDGFMDEVHAWRDQYAADVVHLLAATGTDFDGVGFHAGAASFATNSDWAFGVDKNPYVVPHEVGHNLGLAHDRPNAGGPGPFSYGFGYSFTGTDGQVYGDIMSYVGKRIGIFSNPRITYKGAAAGVLKSEPNSADNVTALNNAAPIVAAYRSPNQQPSSAPRLEITKPEFNFGRQNLGEYSTYRYLGLTNRGATPLQITDFHTTGDAGEFQVFFYDFAAQKLVEPTRDFTIAPGQSVTINAFYRPVLSYGEANALLTFKTNDPSQAGLPIELPLTGAAGPQLQNISSRLGVKTGEDVLIAGLIVGGSSPRRIAVRAIGSSLSQAGLSGVLADPVLELHGPDGVIAMNDDWGAGSTRAAVQSSGITPASDLEAVIIQTLPPGGYTAVVRGNDNGTGIALVEAYNLDADTRSEMLNISTRGRVEQGDEVMIAGFILGGGAYSDVVVRGIGPSLGAAGVSGALQDPALELRGPQGDLLAFNDSWQDEQSAELIATTLNPADNREAAIFAALPPGAYTAVVRGSNATTGIGLVEVFKPRSGAVALASGRHFNTLVPTATKSPAQGFAYGKILSEDATRLFWFEYDEAAGDAGGSIKSTPKTGGGVTTLASGLGAVNGLVADDTFLYWSEAAPNGAGFIKRIGKDGSGYSVIASGTPQRADGSLGRPVSKVGALCTDAAAVYWVQNDASPALIRKVSKSGGTVLDVLSGSIARDSLVTDGSSLYFYGRDGTIKRVANTGGAPTVLVSNIFSSVDSGFPQIKVDGSSLYFLEASGSLSVIPGSGGAVTNLAKAITPHDFAIDAQYVYYQSGGRIFRISKAGGSSGQLVPYSHEGANPFSVAVDANSLYYSNAGRRPGEGALIAADKAAFGSAIEKPAAAAVLSSLR